MCIRSTMQEVSAKDVTPKWAAQDSPRNAFTRIDPLMREGCVLTAISSGTIEIADLNELDYEVSKITLNHTLSKIQFYCLSKVD